MVSCLDLTTPGGIISRALGIRAFVVIAATIEANPFVHEYHGIMNERGDRILGLRVDPRSRHTRYANVLVWLGSEFSDSVIRLNLSVRSPFLTTTKSNGAGSFAVGSS